ncbi:hypothetical protein EXN66_Car015249 [Channa argus]|uniref:Uncharacterized protein n=1 Tax=Channa argus TaxID=215402 RepID=A0A6G1QAJ4_CHAAH|nr:hypothetical protein EXN66_Car015249 [Channa argus]
MCKRERATTTGRCSSSGSQAARRAAVCAALNAGKARWKERARTHSVYLSECERVAGFVWERVGNKSKSPRHNVLREMKGKDKKTEGLKVVLGGRKVFGDMESQIARFSPTRGNTATGAGKFSAVIYRRFGRAFTPGSGDFVSPGLYPQIGSNYAEIFRSLKRRIFIVFRRSEGMRRCA